MTIERLFVNMKQLSFVAFAQTIFGYRLYVECAMPGKTVAVNGSDVLTLDDANFKLCYTKLPKRLVYLIDSSEVPD